MAKKSSKNILTAFLLNFIFSVIELVGGIFTNSISIISDSVHDFGDAISIAIAWLLEKKSEKKPNEKYTYGYLRYSVLGALVTSVILLIGSVLMVYNAIPRLLNPVEVKYNGMLILAILGLTINGIGAYKTAKGEKISEKTVSLHLLEDVLGWMGVLVISIAIKIFKAPILDPIFSLVITAFILVNVVKNIKIIFEIFLEKAPRDINIEEIKEELLRNDKIQDIHHIHIWTLDGIKKYMTMHVLVNSNISNQEIIELKKEIHKELKENKIHHITIEIEFDNENCNKYECYIDMEEDQSHLGHHH